MNEFITPLDLRAHVPGEWLLLSPLKYQSGATVITAPAGFVTDLASIPALFRPLLNSNGRSRRSAVLHDWLYCTKEGARADADSLFLEALKADGVGFAERWAMYLGVRAGGWMYWGKRDGLSADDFAVVG